MPSQTTGQTDRGAFASPGFCRIDHEGIHVLNRYKPGHLIRWAEIRAVEMPSGQCRHDYLKVVTQAKHCPNAVPVADRDHAKSALEAIRRYRPDVTNGN